MSCNMCCPCNNGRTRSRSSSEQRHRTSCTASLNSFSNGSPQLRVVHHRNDQNLLNQSPQLSKKQKKRNRGSFDVPAIFEPIQVDSPAAITRVKRRNSFEHLNKRNNLLNSSTETLRGSDDDEESCRRKHEDLIYEECGPPLQVTAIATADTHIYYEPPDVIPVMPPDECPESSGSESSRSLTFSICHYPGCDSVEVLEPLLESSSAHDFHQIDPTPFPPYKQNQQQPLQFRNPVVQLYKDNQAIYARPRPKAMRMKQQQHPAYDQPPSSAQIPLVQTVNNETIITLLPLQASAQHSLDFGLLNLHHIDSDAYSSCSSSNLSYQTQSTTSTCNSQTPWIKRINREMRTKPKPPRKDKERRDLPNQPEMEQFRPSPGPVLTPSLQGEKPKKPERNNLKSLNEITRNQDVHEERTNKDENDSNNGSYSSSLDMLIYPAQRKPQTVTLYSRTYSDPDNGVITAANNNRKYYSSTAATVNKYNNKDSLGNVIVPPCISPQLTVINPPTCSVLQEKGLYNLMNLLRLDMGQRVDYGVTPELLPGTSFTYSLPTPTTPPASCTSVISVQTQPPFDDAFNNKENENMEDEKVFLDKVREPSLTSHPPNLDLHAQPNQATTTPPYSQWTPFVLDSPNEYIPIGYDYCSPSPSLSALSAAEYHAYLESVSSCSSSRFGDGPTPTPGATAALDLASQSNVQDAFVIAVEQQARERLEKLSALKRIKPVDMTKLSHQLSEAPTGSSETANELNGLIEAATGSPIYVTSVPELSSSQLALHRAIGSNDLAKQKRPSLQSASPVSDKSGSAANTSVSSGIAKNVNVVVSNKSPVLISNGVKQKGSVVVSSVVPESKTSTAQDTVLSAGGLSPQVVPNRLSSAEKPRGVHQKPAYKETAIITSKPTSLENITGSQESIEAAKSTAGGRATSKSSSRESVVDQSQYANMINMVEWENEGPHRVELGGREMAVDVPDSFIPRNKTPPRYPPSKAATLTSASAGVMSNKTGAGSRNSGLIVTGNGSSTLPGHANGAPGKPVPPPRIADKDSWANNNNTTAAATMNTGTAVPHVLPRTILSPNKTTPDQITPSTDQADRIRKYQEELKKRREQEEQQAKEAEFLRTSLRGSKKLQQLESLRNERETPQYPQVAGFVNDAYETVDEYISPAYVTHQELFLKKPVGISELVASLQRVQEALKKNGMQLEDTVSAVGVLMQSPEFQQVLAVHNKVQDVWCFNSPPTPITAHAQQFVQECLGSLHYCSVPEAIELVDVLTKVDFEGIIYAHDKIAERERLLLSTETPLNLGESVDDVALPKTSRPAFIPEQPDDHIKVVRIEKTQDPLGATVRNEGEAVVIGRIVKGGAAERSGSLHEGDEVLEVNGLEMRGKTVNEVCDILSRMTGTLTFLIVPSPNPPSQIPQRRDILIHVRAHFDYDPEDDIYVPCRELGIAFSKGDVLHVISQEDANWWQAHREGEEDQALAGLIPSKSFQEQREAVKQSLLGETESREKSKRGTLLCAKTHKKKKKKVPYSTAFNDDFDAEEIPTYEEVALYYPRTSFKRPVVLIGPPNIGRHELRQRLMQESERFAAAVPHTSRTRKEGELDGQDYHFCTRAQFEADILARKFVEHGEFEKNYYGTSLEAIRSVVNMGKICVLNLHPQSLKILRNSDLKPYIVFIAPPPLERLKQMRISRGEAYKEDELIDIIEKAREMEDKYGHYFDLVIINNDIERTYYELVQRINYIEREPQWVPAFWLK